MCVEIESICVHIQQYFFLLKNVIRWFLVWFDVWWTGGHLVCRVCGCTEFELEIDKASSWSVHTPSVCIGSSSTYRVDGVNKNSRNTFFFLVVCARAVTSLGSGCIAVTPLGSTVAHTDTGTGSKEGSTSPMHACMHI